MNGQKDTRSRPKTSTVSTLNHCGKGAEVDRQRHKGKVNGNAMSYRPRRTQTTPTCLLVKPKGKAGTDASGVTGSRASTC